MRCMKVVLPEPVTEEHINSMLLNQMTDDGSYQTYQPSLHTLRPLAATPGCLQGPASVSLMLPWPAVVGKFRILLVVPVTAG